MHVHSDGGGDAAGAMGGGVASAGGANGSVASAGGANGSVASGVSGGVRSHGGEARSACAVLPFVVGLQTASGGGEQTRDDGAGPRDGGARSTAHDGEVGAAALGRDGWYELRSSAVACGCLAGEAAAAAASSAAVPPGPSSAYAPGGCPARSAARSAATYAGGATAAATYAAVGLPRGCCLAVLPTKQYAVREALGSAPPLRLSRSALSEWERRRGVRRVRRGVERERLANLQRIHEHERSLVPKPAVRTLPGGGGRALCERCDGCAGFRDVLVSRVVPAPYGLADCCAECGCPRECHHTRKK